MNNVSILTNFTLPNGNEVLLISEVLFVSEAVVSRLHQVRYFKHIINSTLFNYYVFLSAAQGQGNPAAVGLPVVWSTVPFALISGSGTR